MEASQSQDYSNNDAETIEAVIYSRVGKVGGKTSVLHVSFSYKAGIEGLLICYYNSFLSLFFFLIFYLQHIIIVKMS